MAERLAEQFHFGNPQCSEVPPPPPVYWNHRLSGKFRRNLWGSAGYGQNLEPHVLSSCRPTAAYTAFALAMICFLSFSRSDRGHIGRWISFGSSVQRFRQL